MRLLAARVQPPAPTAAEREASSARRVDRARQLGANARRIGRNGQEAGRRVWSPFAHAGSVLWLEITGAFFALFTLFFLQHMWELRAAWRSGAEHQHFLTYAACTALFGWFAVSSFGRARRRTRRRARELQAR
jgi:hypothetical protein